MKLTKLAEPKAPSLTDEARYYADWLDSRPNYEKPFGVFEAARLLRQLADALDASRSTAEGG